MSRVAVTSAIQDVLDEVNSLRSTLGPRTAFTDPEFLTDLATRLKGTKALRRQPIAECFIDDAEQYGARPHLEATKRHINEARDTHLFSLFNASYFPKLSLDYLVYDPLPVDENLARSFPSHTTPVTLRHLTKGFQARTVVALFPENHIDGLQLPEDRIFYFIDKFVERFRRITCKMLDAVIAPDAFPLVRAATDAQVERAATYWVWLHEYHHRQGDMPLPTYLPTKSLKPLAGLEELRVDVSGMLACLSHPGLPPAEAALAHQFILAERLLRYAVEGIPKPNYDAVASQVLFNFLIEHDGIRLSDDGVMHLCPPLVDVLAEFLGNIHAIERHIASEPVDKVQRRLLDFVDSYAVYDPELGDYRHVPYFADVKARLGV